ncbi:diacylglycerol kinase eta isoform X3 [Onthophagus taurus]|uniref:diacylglycerol kinase eta isoform X3 n=1 Tax=Onthophagus taurus TaxID=166361 RepID=UPI0039BDE077
MASGGKSAKGSVSPAAGEDSSESDAETEPAVSFHRRLSTNRDIKCSTSIKEGFLLKQTWSFQRWRRRYFKLRGRKLYYAKDTKVITPYRSLVLCAESRREMEEWVSALHNASKRRYYENDQPDCLSGCHHWYATSHARPTYCNVCRDALHGVTSHGLSCEVCKCKVHKRCAAKAINNCKWTTLSSVGNEIIEDPDGSITMPHQWMEGNLPVSASCGVCHKPCGSVLKLVGWRCLWCRTTVHVECRPHLPKACPLGPARVSVVPPTALHSIQDEAWECVRPQASSPLLVFVNSKSGDNQGVKFLRRFKQLLNPAQVFDLITTGPRVGLRLFRHFDPFRILVCSGDGSVGWVLSEIDKLDMHKQCQLAVLPLGTGNDLARVLGWGSSCDDDTHLPQLLEKYERASTKILDRWSIMIHERTIAMPKLSLVPGVSEELHSQMSEYETNLVDHLHKILQSDETSVVLSSAKRLCEIVKEFASQVSESSLIRGDEQLSKKCDILQQKLDLLLQTLTSEQIDATKIEFGDDEDSITKSNQKEDTESEISYDSKLKTEKDLSNFNFRKHRRTSRFMEREKDALIMRANSLKRAIRSLVEHTEKAVDAQNRLKNDETSIKITLDSMEKEHQKMDSLKVLSTIDSASISDVSSTTSNSSILTTRLVNISPIPDVRRESTCEDCPDFLNVPAPPDFADSRRPSQIHSISDTNKTDTEKILIETCNTLQSIQKDETTGNERIISITVHATDNQELIEEPDKRRYSKGIRKEEVEIDVVIEEEEKNNGDEDEKECSSIISAISNEEISIVSEVAGDQKSFCPRKNSDGEDVNGHIGHIDSPETDTYPNSDALQGCESLMDDISSMLGNDLCGYDSMENTYTDDTTLFHSEFSESKMGKERRKSMKRDSLERKRRCSRSNIENDETTQYGFENRVFMSVQNVDQPKYCSLAQFVEGNDIARRSFKRGRQSKLQKVTTESTLHRQNTLTEESEGSLNGSQISLNEKKCEEKDDFHQFPQVCVIVEPPSPDLNETIRQERMDKISIEIEIEDTPFRKNVQLSTSDMTSNNSSNSNLLGIDNEHFLSCSPAATRRISCCSMLNANEAAMVAAAAAASAREKKEDKEGIKEKEKKKLPIINPLVRLPSWPNVNSGAGFISKCLLANADTLCAAVSPLIDPEETLMEGFFERCVMNNYFGIGIDAKISLDFHHKREEHPEKCRSRAKNYMWYGVLGSKQWFVKSYKNLDQRVQLECDGQRIPLPSLQGIVILNIPSFMGGTNFWGGTKEDEIFLAPSMDDKILEVVAVFGSVQMAASRLINLSHHRIAQCQSVQINILGDEGVPVQVDGEAWVQTPGNIRIIHKNRMQVLCRNKALETSLKIWEEKQRAAIGTPCKRGSLSHDRGRSSLTRQSMPAAPEKSFLGVNIEKIRQHSFSGHIPVHERSPPTVSFVEKPIPSNEPEILFTDEEHYLLINFIECSTTLVKWIKLLAISHNLEVDLYTLATKTDQALEDIHPNGKLLAGPRLRIEFTKLVGIVRHLYEETCELLHVRGERLRLREDLENKLSASLTNMELELRKCVMYDTASGSLAFLQHIPEHHQKRRSIFGLKFRSKSVSGPQQTPNSKSARDVDSWGTMEVATWLETLQLSEYVDSFIKNDIRGRELLTLARRDLKEIGVTKVGHIKRILQAIKDLTQGG